MALIMGIDLGSTSIKSVIYDETGRMVSQASRPTVLSHNDENHPSWSVWEPDAIWDAVCSATQQALAGLSDKSEVKGVAVTGFGMDGLPVAEDGTFLYPLDTHFEPGILDLRELTVTEEADRYCFDLRLEKLSQPGWHPEYGFQLTYAALCLRTPGGTRGPVGANSNYVFESGPLASRIVFVGGGVRVEDESGERLAEFIPRSTEDAFGSVETGRIAFCLSKHYFPDDAPNGIWTVLVGAQDDHGGAGLGEFRSVNAEAERWAGGGRTDPDQSNVYDVGHSGPVQE